MTHDMDGSFCHLVFQHRILEAGRNGKGVLQAGLWEHRHSEIRLDQLDFDQELICLAVHFWKIPAFIHKGKVMSLNKNILPVILGHGDKILVFEQGEIRRTGSSALANLFP